MTRPRVGVSACLLGERVRYDGAHKRAQHLLDGLGPHVEWVPVCPELEAGLGVPRPAMRLVRAGPDVRMVEIESQLSVMQASIPVKLAQISEVRRLLQPLESDFRQIRAYHARLSYIERKAEEKELEKEQEEVEADEKLTTRRRKGLDRFI